MGIKKQNFFVIGSKILAKIRKYGYNQKKRLGVAVT